MRWRYDRYDTKHTEGDTFRRFALFRYELGFIRRGQICCSVDDEEIKGGGNKNEVMCSPLLQQKRRTRQLYCSQNPGPVGRHFTGLNRKVINLFLSWITRIFPVVENGMFPSKLHKFNVCFHHSCLHELVKRVKGPVIFPPCVTICLRLSDRRQRVEFSSHRFDPTWPYRHRVIFSERSPHLEPGVESYRNIILLPSYRPSYL